jgi:hypothetical protein
MRELCGRDWSCINYESRAMVVQIQLEETLDALRNVTRELSEMKSEISYLKSGYCGGDLPDKCSKKP